MHIHQHQSASFGETPRNAACEAVRPRPSSRRGRRGGARGRANRGGRGRRRQHWLRTRRPVQAPSGTHPSSGIFHERKMKKTTLADLILTINGRLGKRGGDAARPPPPPDAPSPSANTPTLFQPRPSSLCGVLLSASCCTAFQEPSVKAVLGRAPPQANNLRHGQDG